MGQRSGRDPRDHGQVLLRTPDPPWTRPGVEGCVCCIGAELSLLTQPPEGTQSNTGDTLSRSQEVNADTILTSGVHRLL